MNSDIKAKKHKIYVYMRIYVYFAMFCCIMQILS